MSILFNKCLAVSLFGLLFLFYGCSDTRPRENSSAQQYKLDALEQRYANANGWNAKVIHADISPTGYVYEHTVLLTNLDTGEEYICTYSDQGTAITPRIYNHNEFAN